MLTEFCKILLKLVTRSTTTAFVGELANFSVGASFILPAGILYLYNRNKKFAIIGCMLGTIVMTVFGSAFNGIYLLPKFAMMAGMDIEKIIGMGTAINPSIRSVTTFVLLCVVPLNLLKGCLVSLFTMLSYKKLSPILKKNI